MRLLLPLLAALMLAACLDGDSKPTPTPTPTPIPTPAATPTPTPIPTPSPTPTPAPILELSASFPQQGGFLMVRLLNPPPGLDQATVSFAGGSYSMLPEGGRWYAIIGLETNFPSGDYLVGVAGPLATLASAYLSVAPTDFQTEYISLPPESAGLLGDTEAILSEKRILDQVYAGFTPQRFWSGPWGLPAQGIITNPFGLLRSINNGPFSPHTGTDFAADLGAPVEAAAAGRIAFAGALYLRGNSVIIDHGAGVFSGYHHLDSIAVSPGQEVAQGQLIGRVGDTGLVSGAHLHWEALVRGVRVDPVLWTYRAFDP